MMERVSERFHTAKSEFLFRVIIIIYASFCDVYMRNLLLHTASLIICVLFRSKKDRNKCIYINVAKLYLKVRKLLANFLTALY